MNGTVSDIRVFVSMKQKRTKDYGISPIRSIFPVG